MDDSINLSCSTEYKDYTYNTKQDIWTLVSLKAPLQEEDESDEKKPPVDVVAVIDISGSMSGGKLALIKKTLEYFLTQCKSFFNPFVPNAPFLYPLKTSETRKVF